MDKSIYGHDYTSPYHIFDENNDKKKKAKNATVKETEIYHETYY